MWTKLAHFIIKYRMLLVILIGLITVFMGYFAVKVEMTYELNKTVPANDPSMIEFMEFKGQFGEDGNMVAVGLKDSAIFKYENFEKFRELCLEMKKIPGVTEVISLPLIQRIEKDTAQTKFNLRPVFPNKVTNQEQLDSLLIEAKNQKFYLGRIVNEYNGATCMLIAVDKNVINSPKRIDLTNTIVATGKKFTDDTNIMFHYAGLPFVRSVVAGQVSAELKRFLGLSVLVTGIIMLVFFRSWRAVIFPMIVIGVVVIWVMGSIVLLGYQITLLSGLIPPIIVVIGIPNAIYLLNKYHSEFALHGNKMLAISRVIRKVGMATFLTNLTTSPQQVTTGCVYGPCLEVTIGPGERLGLALPLTIGDMWLHSSKNLTIVDSVRSGVWEISVISKDLAPTICDSWHPQINPMEPLISSTVEMKRGRQENPIHVSLLNA